MSKVAVLGAAGGIGQPLSLLLKSDPNSGIKQLALYDIANMGMAADLAHVPTPAKVRGYSGEGELQGCLEQADVVIIPAGVPRKPGMTRDDLFTVNASIVRNLVKACAQHCPKAHLLIISNPVNSTVPIAWETMRAMGVERPSVFGVTTLDLVRAKTFIGEAKGVDPRTVQVKVVGGHSGPTIVPLLSTATSNGQKLNFTEEEMKGIIQRVQYGGDEVVKAKAGTGSATLSMAYAAKSFYDSFVSAIGSGSEKLTAFVKTDQYETGYFAADLELDEHGKIKQIEKLKMEKESEQQLMQTAMTDLKKDVQKGIEFAKAN